jgi:hypothetical protein
MIRGRGRSGRRTARGPCGLRWAGASCGGRGARAGTGERVGAFTALLGLSPARDHGTALSAPPDITRGWLRLWQQVCRLSAAGAAHLGDSGHGVTDGGGAHFVVRGADMVIHGDGRRPCLEAQGRREDSPRRGPHCHSAWPHSVLHGESLWGQYLMSQNASAALASGCTSGWCPAGRRQRTRGRAAACSPCTMRSETCAKTVCSEVFGIFSRTLLTKQVPDPSSTGHRILEYRLRGVFLWVIADA